MNAKDKAIEGLNRLAKGKQSQWIADASARLAQDSTARERAQTVALGILRKLRANKQNGILPHTQVQLAGILGVSPQQVGKWVKGHANFTFETVSKLEAALNIRLMEIHYEDGGFPLSN